MALKKTVLKEAGGGVESVGASPPVRHVPSDQYHPINIAPSPGLREKLAFSARGPKPRLETVRGVGYRLRVGPDAKQNGS